MKKKIFLIPKTEQRTRKVMHIIKGKEIQDHQESKESGKKE